MFTRPTCVLSKAHKTGSPDCLKDKNDCYGSAHTSLPTSEALLGNLKERLKRTVVTSIILEDPRHLDVT